jgi:hypothetical protein
VRAPTLFFVGNFPTFWSIQGLASQPRFQELCRRVLPTAGAG